MNEVEEEKSSVGDVLSGLRFLAPDWENTSAKPSQAYFLIKTRDPQGRTGWGFRVTPGITQEALLGVLRIHIGLLREELVAEWRD